MGGMEWVSSMRSALIVSLAFPRLLVVLPGSCFLRFLYFMTVTACVVS